MTHDPHPLACDPLRGSHARGCGGILPQDFLSPEICFVLNYALKTFKSYTLKGVAHRSFKGGKLA